MRKTLAAIVCIAVLLGGTNSPSQESRPLAESQPVSPALPPTTQPAAESQPSVPNDLKEIKSLGDMPEFQGIDQWFNGSALTKAQLKGKVVLVDFWTYSCVNCLRTLPYLKEWYKKYKSRGLVIVGVHSPEFEFERDPANVKMAIDKYQIPYPVALDNKMQTWLAFKSNAWPAHYFIDRQGRIRHVHLGEGNYDESEILIQKLLLESATPKSETQPASTETKPSSESQPAETQTMRRGKKGKGRKAAPSSKPAPETAPANPATQGALPPLSMLPPDVDFDQIKSPETYTGLLRRQRLVTSGRPLELNEWSYEGNWRTEGERITLSDGTGKIRFRFSATKANIVLRPLAAGGVQAVVRLDGQVVPPEKAGIDVKNGTLIVNEPRMYELINLGSKGEEHTVEIEFLMPGVSAYAFTFG